MLITTHAPPSPSRKPITSPTKRAMTTRLSSFNAALPDTSFHYALTFPEKLSEKSRRRLQRSITGHRNATFRPIFASVYRPSFTVGALLVPLFGQFL
jgi:hypothetical protein